jgi:hypothetical protein
MEDRKYKVGQVWESKPGKWKILEMEGGRITKYSCVVDWNGYGVSENIQDVLEDGDAFAGLTLEESWLVNSILEKYGDTM